MLVVEKNPLEIERLKKELSKSFDIKYFSSTQHILGMKVSHDRRTLSR